MSRKSRIVVGIVLMVLVVAAGAAIRAQGPQQVRACATCGPPQGGGNLPPVFRGAMDITPVGEALSILSFDDGSCESGLGAGTTMAVTDLVDFDVPTQCIQAGLDIVGVTTRVNTGQSASNFAFGQAGAAAPPAGGAGLVGISAIPPIGACAGGTGLTSRAIGPGAAIITGTGNFFAGIQVAGFAGRDSNGPPAGRMWLNCSFCGMTQYTPTTLSSIGLGGNWMIRVTVEDQNCIPVELMGFDVS